ncbi:MAG: dihydrofolate reductase [Burkholderiales bacterium]|jgi:dihydrofolate reductase|nr:dihydrofolate reductase [Burkholderiales bacterium]
MNEFAETLTGCEMSYTIPAILAKSNLFRSPFPLAIIAAKARNGVVGQAGQLPWRLPEDLRHFRELTTGHTVVMGRKTWESLPHALPKRQNIVVTRNPAYTAPGAQTAPTLETALAAATEPAPVFCIGGGELYRQALPISSVLFLTEIDADFDGDTYFPPLDPTDWRRVIHTPHTQTTNPGLRYAFNVYLRAVGARAEKKPSSSRGKVLTSSEGA